MNISFVFPQTLGNARRFLVNEMLSAAAKQQGHNVVAANQADFVVLFDNAIPQEAAGKQGAILDLEQAFAQPKPVSNKRSKMHKLLQMLPQPLRFQRFHLV